MRHSELLMLTESAMRSLMNLFSNVSTSQEHAVKERQLISELERDRREFE